MDATDEVYDVIVAGTGAAGLAAALTAIDTARELATGDLSVLVVDRAPRDHAGGNSFWSTAGFRMPDTTRVNDRFVESFAAVGVTAPDYVARLAADAPAALQWLAGKGVRFRPPRIFLTSDDPRISPEGQGAEIVTALRRELERHTSGVFYERDGQSHAAGVEIRYATEATDLVRDDDGTVVGMTLRGPDGEVRSVRATAVVLATGGFEGNPEMMRRHVGYVVPTICRGGSYNTGAGITMALAAGARRTGRWDNFHPLPADPRSAGGDRGLLTFAAIMETVPYSIMLNRKAARFMDEGVTTMDLLYDEVGRAVQAQPEQIAYAVFDAKTAGLPQWREAVSRDLLDEPYSAATIGELAAQLGIDPEAARETVAAYNAAAPDGGARFDAMRPDGLRTAPGLTPAKSNWAQRVDTAPFYAFPVTCANVFTMGGIGTSPAAEVVTEAGDPIPGLYAAGEMTGLYQAKYVGATSYLRSLVFGRIAGRNAATRALGLG
ncbi:FAD-dependent oxidoreductase [Micromonospora cathayae]|uniref:FAD-binding protein n=1 Tax=Micromonospora cathayae TaxID=3028804 RepID=A0ABY7ZLF7_9ACTN|nr:FAD-dependent oxidoreductase [Micromonospora sp. HUAS 3]WDZ83785.1 FAD-binding protein [Micromonospora sp. HUAS 3]